MNTNENTTKIDTRLETIIRKRYNNRTSGEIRIFSSPGFISNRAKILPGSKKLITMPLNRSGQIVTNHSVEELKDYSINVDYQFWKDFIIRIPHNGIRLDLGVESDLLTYRLLPIITSIAENKDSVNNTHDFYIEDLEHIARNKLSKAQLKYKAMEEFNKMSIAEHTQYLTLFGVPVSNLSATIVQHKLVEIIERHPEQFLNFTKDPASTTTRVLIGLAVEHKLLDLRGSSGPYFYNSIHLGNTVEEATNFLKASKNKDIHNAILSQLRSKTNLIAELKL